MVARSGLAVEIRRLPEGGAPFILALKDGKTIGEAATLALRESSAFDLKANLAGLMASGAIVAVARLQAANERWVKEKGAPPTRDALLVLACRVTPPCCR